MNNKYIYVIGLMSGTSLDGVDLIYTRFDTEVDSAFKILAAKTYSYDSNWKQILKTAIDSSEEILKILDQDYGIFLGELINIFRKEHEIERIDFIASHGHTVMHQPNQGITLQIGDGQQISNITQFKVICDFRTQDVLLGGQGAPLVPIGDRVLFGEYEACLNLGGFANISFEDGDLRIAYDVCPMNTVLNYYSQRIGFEYDNGGNLAAEGQVNDDLLHDLNSLEFYQQEPPKSLGIEWVQWFVFNIIDQYHIEIEDILRTFVEHIAIQLAISLKGKKSVLVTGGGVYNAFLINRLKGLYAGELIVPESELIEFKEALIFAFLGVLKTKNQVNSLSSVTGASKDHSAGRIFHPKIH